MRVPSCKNYKAKNKKDSEKEKNLYHALYNKINSNNIIDYFVFDENENNIIKNPKNNRNIILKEDKKLNKKEQKIKVEYYVNSFITSGIRPDLYCPYGIISGNIYELKSAPNKSLKKIEEKEDEEKVEERQVKIEEDKTSSISISDKEKRDKLKEIKLLSKYN